MPMDRGRGRGRATKKRTTLPSHSHFHTPTTHQFSFPTRSPDLVTPSFGLDSPSAAMAGGPSARNKRARTFDATPDGAAAYDDDGISKGGHSLRKRARVDYTQEFDELLPALAKSDTASKSAATPSARSRKRRQTQGSEADGDNLNASTTGQRRRKPEKSPAPSRGGLARRRNSRKSTTEVSSYQVNQAVEDEVQDTILVGFPTDGLLEDAEDSDDSNSFDESESRPSTSDGSDTAMAQADAEPATPKQQSSPRVDQVVSLVPETEEAIEKTLITDQPNGKPEVVPEPIPVHQLLPKEPDEPNPQHEADEVARETAQTEIIEKQPQEEPEAVPSPPPETITPKVEPNAELPPEVEQPASTQPDASTAEPQPSPTICSEEPAREPDAKLLSESSVNSPAPPLEIAPLVRRGSTASSRRARAARPTEPIRLKALEKIHNTPTPFGSQLRLTPYEAEDVVHPGAFTEWVRPDAKDRVEMTPMPTPAPTPSPIDFASIEIKWDGHRPLKKSEFFELYRQEKKRRQERGEEPISMAEFNNQCVRRFKAAQSQPGTERSTPSTDSVRMSRPGPRAVPKRPTLITSASFDETPHGSQADSQQPTAAPSPVAADEEESQLDAEADDAEEQATAEPESTAKAGGPTGPIEVTRNPARQFIFPKIRDPQEFVDAMEGWQDMDTDKLYTTVAAAVEAMDAYQMEYNELKKIVDDEENAKRRIANDKTIINWENRQKMDEPAPWRRHFDEPVKGPPVFEVRGARAPKPYIDDPVLEHQREEDKLMAQVYGFKHNAHPTQVGRQNPEEQRWENAENRLRERKKTEKGAELAEENVIEGKRMRKPRNFSDQSKEPSRSGTPIGAMSLPGRRFRRKFATKDDDDAEPQDAQPEPEPVAPPAPVVRRRRGGFRGGRGGQTTIEQFYPAPTSSASQADVNQTDEEIADEKPGSARKRGRGLAPPPPPAVSENDSLKSKRRDANAKTEIASSSFYSNVSADSLAESRPSTASSAATVNTEETGESTGTYSLRDKRKRNFALENDPELETRPQKRTRGIMLPKLDGMEPKKRTPRRKTTATSQLPSASTEPPAPAPITAPVPVPAPIPMHPPAALIAPQPVGGLQAPLFFSHPPPALAPAPGPYLHTFSAAPAFPPGGNPPPPAAPPAVKKPITKLKLTNNGSSSQNSSRAATPANIAPNPTPKIVTKTSRGAKAPESGLAKPAMSNGAVLDEKPYAEMSKSEKMSWSMRRRWASGEMQGAVEKRRTTLANKKAEKAAGTPTANNSDSGAPGSAGGSASGTPTPIPMPMPGPGPLAMPGQGQPIQPLQPHGLLPPQGMVYYGPPGVGPSM
ncbi:hypothetical protein QBC34DRAFT_415792 [Podospora aff. communis PSN243]|uniref:Uncharacterized protein n=1 Tax=Podospora aff. communis PSN243 TaxID=3040156 RepID=A0AAV9G8L4_9PEZI|nr:hypothetical protein QBC34DRAFT_415792 [Podospora aff. communis PSN243]